MNNAASFVTPQSHQQICASFAAIVQLHATASWLVAYEQCAPHCRRLAATRRTYCARFHARPMVGVIQLQPTSYAGQNSRYIASGQALRRYSNISPAAAGSELMTYERLFALDAEKKNRRTGRISLLLLIPYTRSAGAVAVTPMVGGVSESAFIGGLVIGFTSLWHC